jgi:hypothetical protein
MNKIYESRKQSLAPSMQPMSIMSCQARIVLKITIFSKENDGLYKCRAQNSNGIDSKDFEIRA